MLGALAWLLDSHGTMSRGARAETQVFFCVSTQLHIWLSSNVGKKSPLCRNITRINTHRCLLLIDLDLLKVHMKTKKLQYTKREQLDCTDEGSFQRTLINISSVEWQQKILCMTTASLSIARTCVNYQCFCGCCVHVVKQHYNECSLECWFALNYDRMSNSRGCKRRSTAGFIKLRDESSCASCVS